LKEIATNLNVLWQFKVIKYSWTISLISTEQYGG